MIGRGRAVLRAVAMIATILVAVACAPGYTVTSTQTIASVTGRVVSGPATDPEFLFDCTWLEDATGRRVEVIYPPGWDVGFRPTRILDATGAVFAREGDLVRVTYIAGGVGESVCSAGGPIAAETVERVDEPPAPRSPDQDATGCRSFRGETVEAVAWSSGGDFLAISTSSNSDGQGRIRVFAWPEMNLVSEAQTDVLAVDDAAIDDAGAVFWFTWDPMADDAVARQLWTLAPGGSATKVGGPSPAGPYVGLVWAGGNLVAMERDQGPPEQWRLVKIDIAQPAAEPVGLTAWTTRLWSTFWADRSGEWVVWDEYDEAGAPQDFVVQHDGRRQVVRPPGYGGRQMTLSPDRKSLIYQRSETARLTVLDLQSGRVTGELSPLEFYGGEVSSTGVLAGLTAHGPGEPNKLCLLDVSDQLRRS